MLQVGRLGCPSSTTSGCPIPHGLEAWTRAHFAAFCLISSPLVLSIALTDENLAPLLDIIGNKRALAINEAWAGHPGTLVRALKPPSGSVELPPDVTCHVGQLSGGDVHVANMSIADGIAFCQNDAHCAGFTAEAAYPSACEAVADVHELRFKDPWGAKRPDTDPK